jgi:hypothetical protein
MWVQFLLIRQSNWTEGRGLQIFETLWAAIEAIETLVLGLQIHVNFKGVNFTFSKKNKI